MAAHIWRFGMFELDEAQGELHKDGRRVRVKPQPLIVLSALLERRGETVTRQELKERLWNGEPAYRTDENLNHAVKRLREALGDSADNPRFVATVRQRGYRFLADISTENVGDLVAQPKDSEKPQPRRPHFSRGKLLLAVASAAALAATFLLLAGPASETTNLPPPLIRATVRLEGGLTFGPVPALAISPDGQTIAYTATGPSRVAQLYVHDLASGSARVVRGSDGARSPFFSPDGTRIGFFSRTKRRYMQVAATGGAPTPFEKAHTNVQGAVWMESGDIVFTSSIFGGLTRLRLDGRSDSLTIPDRARREKNHRLPDPLPGGKAILMTVGTIDITSFDDASIAVFDLETGKTRVILEGGTSARYSPDGHIVFWRSGSLHAAPFDVETMRITGPPKAVQTEVSAAPYGAAQFAIARNGTLIFAPGPTRFRTTQLSWVDREGRAEPLPTGAAPAPGEIANISFSKDGRQLVFAVGGATDQVWTHDLERGSTSPLTFEWDNIFPTWAPDGRRVAFWSNRDRTHSICIKERNSGRADERVYSATGRTWPTSWSTDGRHLLFMEHRDGSKWDLRLVEFDAGPSVRTWLSTPFNEGLGLFSPSGTWVVHESDESGRMEIYVRPFQHPDTKWRVSTHGGETPRWAPNEKELFYWEDDELMAVDVSEANGMLVLGKPEPLFENDVWPKHYDISPDGKRFVMAQATNPAPAPTELQLVLNWAQHLDEP